MATIIAMVLRLAEDSATLRGARAMLLSLLLPDLLPSEPSQRLVSIKECELK
jgi:hypothetical protein